MGQAPVVQEVAADVEGKEGPPAVDDDREAEDPQQGPALAGGSRLGAVVHSRPTPRRGGRSPLGGHAGGTRDERRSMDPIALLTSAVMATIVSALLFVLPGTALGPLVLPGRRPRWRGSVERRASVYWPPSSPAPSSPARVHSRRRRHGHPGGPLSALGLLVRRPAPRLPSGRSAGRRRALVGRRGCGTALALALIVIPSHLGVRPDLLPRSSTTWYYLNLAQATADLGAFPAQLAEWGALRPFQTDYLPVTAHTAAALLLLPGDTLVRLELYRLYRLALGVLFATLLFRRWVSGWPRSRGDPPAWDRAPRAEVRRLPPGDRRSGAGSVHAVGRRPRLRRTKSSGVRAGARRRRVVFLSHAEVFLILGPVLVGIAVARAVVAPGRSQGGWGFAGRPHGRPPLRRWRSRSSWAGRGSAWLPAGP